MLEGQVWILGEGRGGEREKEKRERKKKRGLAPDSLLFWKKNQKYNSKQHPHISLVQHAPEPSMFSVAQPDLLTSRLFHCSSTHDWKGSPMTGQNTFNHWLNSGRVVLRECQNRSKCKNNHLLKQTPPPHNLNPNPPPPICYLLFCWWMLHFSSISPSNDLQVRIVFKKIYI